MHNTMIQGDCRLVLSMLPSASVDFVLTDPPYFVKYKDRSARMVRNDRCPGGVLEAFKDVCRVLKPDELCPSIAGITSMLSPPCGKPQASRLWATWSSAKTYASSQRFLRYSHECAYLLAKGKPRVPENPISDVLPWHYSGNRAHSNEKAVETLKPIAEAFTKTGDTIIDPFAGSGSTLIAAVGPSVGPGQDQRPAGAVQSCDRQALSRR